MRKLIIPWSGAATRPLPYQCEGVTLDLKIAGLHSPISPLLLGHTSGALVMYTLTVNHSHTQANEQRAKKVTKQL